MAENLEPLEAERACLGAAIQSVEALEALSESLRAEHFATDSHRRIYSAILALHSRSERVDLVTIRNEIQDDRLAAYVAGLLDGLPIARNVDSWVKVVHDNARLRALVTLGANFPKWIEESCGQPDLVVDRAQQALQRIHEAGNRTSYVVDIREAMAGAMRLLDAKFASGGIPGIRSGVSELDSLTGGLQPGSLYTVAARTGRGKSVLSTQVALHAIANGRKVLMFSLEMTPEQVGVRMLLADSGVALYELERGEQYAWGKLSKSYSELIEHSMEFDRRAAPTLMQIKTHAEQMKRQRGLDLVIVDYFQRCSTNAKTENRTQALSELARGLKSLAQTVGVPVLLPAQLNRNAEGQRPRLADIKECGTLEEESDVVMFIHPQPQSGVDPDMLLLQENAPVDLIVEKNRHGENRVIPLIFERRYVRFVAGRDTDAGRTRIPEPQSTGGVRWDVDQVGERK